MVVDFYSQHILGFQEHKIEKEKRKKKKERKLKIY